LEHVEAIRKGDDIDRAQAGTNMNASALLKTWKVLDWKRSILWSGVARLNIGNGPFAHRHLLICVA
jgi:hypothetical protein